MKRLFLALILTAVMITLAYADGPVWHADVYENGLSELENITTVFAGPDGVYANRVWSVTVDSGDFSTVASGSDWAKQAEAQSNTASGTNASVDTVGFYDGAKVLGYIPTPSKSVTSGETYSFGTQNIVVFKAGIVTP